MELLGISEAARRLKVHPDTLRGWCNHGIVNPIRDSAGKRLFFAEVVEGIAQSRAAKRGEVSK